MTAIVIETVNLSRRFGKLTAVDKLDLKVPCANVYGFLGPNGAGKTTTIRMLLGLIHPSEGNVKLFGTPLAQNRIPLLQIVGALVETPSLYPHLTGSENLEVTGRLMGAQRNQIERALEIVRLGQDAYRRVREYSLGMRQRLALALALLNEPKLLILDEPTNGLDPAGIHEIRDLVRSFPAEFGITVFLSSHLLGEVEQIASHIGIIHQRHLLFQGTLKELQMQRQERILLTVDQPTVAGQILTRMGWAVQQIGANRLVIPSSRPEQAAEVNTLLVRQGINITHLGIEQPSLENIFLQLTQGSEPKRSSQ